MKVDNTLLKKFNKKGPRYTSYPPATHFTENYDDKDFINFKFYPVTVGKKLKQSN